VRIARGLYRFRDYPAQPGDEIVAAWLRQAPDAVVSHESALEVLDLADTIADRVHLTVPRSRRRLVPQDGVAIHTTTHPLAPGDVITRRGMRVTAPARTIADVAAAGVAPDQVTAAVHTALERGMTTASLLREATGIRGRRVQRVVEAALSGGGA
jgi:predicted transcriptional regulator of viral defense system